MRIKPDIHINSKEKPQHDKKLLSYVNSIRIWYLSGPLLALFFYRLELLSALKIYEGILLLLSIACILSEIYHKGAWWDRECIDLQEESRDNSKRKWGIFYIRPFLFAIPSVLVLIILEWNQIAFLIGDFLRAIM